MKNFTDYCLFAAAFIILSLMSLISYSQDKINYGKAEVDSLLKAHYEIAESINFNGHCYEDAIDLSDLEYYHDEYMKHPTSDNYDRFLKEDSKISKYESDMVAGF